MQIVNIAAYKFVSVPEPQLWLPELIKRCEQLELKGTIIIAAEGINLFLAGERCHIDSFLEFLRHDDLFGGRFAEIEVKESFSDRVPFKRMVVRQAKEIITMRCPAIDPAQKRAPAVSAQTLKKWIEQGRDEEGRELVLLDTRNKFEVDIGTFDDAIDLNIERFSQFPEAIAKLKDEIKEKTVVSFCTGGIRCEKAVLYLMDLGLPSVFQLEGGILRYFEEVGGAHWKNDCFVFDERIALQPNLEKTTKISTR